MGYSNNKWRKILYILMIINLCFVLFAKITRVFGYYSENPTSVTLNNNIYDLDIDYITNNFDYYFLSWNKFYQNGRYITQISLYCANSEISINTASNSLKIEQGQKINTFLAQYKGSDPDYPFTNVVNAWNSTQFSPTLTTSHTYVNNSTTIITQNYGTGFGYDPNTYYITLANYDVKDQNGDTVFENNIIKYPQIANTQQQLETLNFDVLSINAWDYSNEDFDVLFYDLNYGSDTTASLYPVNVITLNKDTLYYNSTLTADPYKNAIYWIPIEEIGFNWVKGNRYGIKFAVRNYDIQGGGGFRGDDYIYEYIGEETVFTVSNTVPDSTITALNNSTQNNIQNNQHEEIINNMNNITNNLDNVNDALTNTTPDSSVSSDIDSALDFNNQNEGLNNLNNGFFSRLTSMLSNLLGYNLGEDTSVSIPLPNSNKSIVLHSIDIYNNVTGALRLIINAFWVYIFSFYMWKFINKIYIAISTGNILDTFSSSGEAITNDML